MRKTDRIKLEVPFEEMIKENFYFKSVVVTELQPDDLVIAHSLHFNRDPFDRLIVATTIRLGLPLMTADGDIAQAKSCEIFWK